MAFKLIRESLIGLCLMFSGCASLRLENLKEYREYNPIGVVGEMTMSAVNEPEIIEFYKSYFPNGKPGFSYKSRIRGYDAGFFVNPSAKFREDIEYQILAGVELKH